MPISLTGDVPAAPVLMSDDRVVILDNPAAAGTAFAVAFLADCAELFCAGEGCVFPAATVFAV